MIEGSEEQGEPPPRRPSPYLRYAQFLRPATRAAAAVDHEPLLQAAFGQGGGRCSERLKSRFRVALEHFSLIREVRPDIFDGVLAVSQTAAFGGKKARLIDRNGIDPDAAVVLAVLDDAIPHAAPSVTGRLASVWVQDAEPRPGSHLPFGRETLGGMLSQIVDDSGPGVRLRGGNALYEITAPAPKAPGKFRARGRFSHGAAVFSEAARDRDVRLPLIAVSLPREAVRDTSGTLLPYFVLLGLLHVMETTRRVAEALVLGTGRSPPRPPIVINLSYGLLAGAKDGTGPFEEVLDALADPALDVPGLGPIHVVVPMGNGRLSRSFAVLRQSDEIGFRMLPDDRTPTFVEVRADEGASLSLSLRPPGGAPIPVGKDAGEGSGEVGSGGIRAYYDDEVAGRRTVVLAFPPTVPDRPGGLCVAPGRWSLEATFASGEVTRAIQRDDSRDGLGSGGRQARFVHEGYETHEPDGRLIERDAGGSPITRAGTINTFASGSNIWSVGGCFEIPPRHPTRPPTRTVPYSGLARPNGSKPEEGDVLAPSDRSLLRPGLLVGSMAGGAPIRVSGTSIAAPQIARRIARFLSENAPARTGAAWPGRATIRNELRNGKDLAEPARRLREY